MQALRRTQQRLLMQVLARSNGGARLLEAVDDVTGPMKRADHAAPADLDQAMLDVWALSEASSADATATAA